MFCVCWGCPLGLTQAQIKGCTPKYDIKGVVWSLRIVGEGSCGGGGFCSDAICMVDVI